MVEQGTLFFNRTLRFGQGALNQAEDLLPPGISRLALVGAPSFLNTPRGEAFKDQLTAWGLKASIFTIHGEPSPQVVDTLSESFRKETSEAVIAVGGGSVLDAAKAAAAMFFEEGSVVDYLEGVGTKQPSGRTLPLLAVPTTSGTGSEATKNAVISSPGPGGFKKSLRHDNYLPQAAILDQDLTLACPPEVTAFCGMDAFSQLLESYLSTEANPLTEALAWEGLTRFLWAFPGLMKEPDNPLLRLDIALGAYCSGLSLANAGLGAVHAMAGALGSLLPAPHGALCGTLVHETFRATVDFWGTGELSFEQATARRKMGRLGSFWANKTLPPYIGCRMIVGELNDWEERYAMPRLSSLGVKRDHLEKAANAGNKNHPYPLTYEDRMAILNKRF